MKKKVPTDVMRQMRERVWKLADEANWNQLTDVDKGVIYGNWVADPQVGGVLGHYMKVTQIRPYIKDAIMKVYVRQSREDCKAPLKNIGLLVSSEVTQKYIKPHGVKLADGKIVCWGRSKVWKDVLMALHERAFADMNSTPYGAVLLDASDGFADKGPRAVVEDAATKLGIRKLVWVG